jgi:hypothetical protein
MTNEDVIDFTNAETAEVAVAVVQVSPAKAVVVPNEVLKGANAKDTVNHECIQTS